MLTLLRTSRGLRTPSRLIYATTLTPRSSFIHTSPPSFKKQSKKMQAAPEPPAEEEDDAQFTKKGKHKGSFSVSELVPASQSKVSPEAKVECDKAQAKMTSTVAWYRKEMSLLENRAQGRVTPAILDGVRVVLPHDESETPLKLLDVATVGVKEGTVLVVTAFDEHNLKAIEKAIYQAKIPHCIPQKADARTLRIPIPKPTVEAQQSFLKTAAKEAEDTKVKLRTAHTAGVKALTKLGFDKRSAELTEMQAITDKATTEVGEILQRLKKALGA